METLNQEMKTYQWALPQSLNIPPDELQVRIDLYHDSIILYFLDRGVITTRMVSARDIALAFLNNVPLHSGILPDSVLWWSHGKEGEEIALWRSPRIWPVAIELEALKPPVRFKIPMPGLVFVCSPGRAPNVYAAKRRPIELDSLLFHAPLFNVYQDGRTCAGTTRYPEKVADIPEAFFLSFFTLHGDYSNRSKSHPDSLFKLWEELDGKKKYPLGDLIPFGKVGDLIK